MLFPGDPGVTSRLVPADKNNFAPRIGIAWDPFGNGRLGIRAAYGLFFEDHRTDPWIYPAVNQPFVIRKNVFNPYQFHRSLSRAGRSVPVHLLAADCAFQLADEPGLLWLHRRTSPILTCIT